MKIALTLLVIVTIAKAQFIPPGPTSCDELGDKSSCNNYCGCVWCHSHEGDESCTRYDDRGDCEKYSECPRGERVAVTILGYFLIAVFGAMLAIILLKVIAFLIQKCISAREKYTPLGEGQQLNSISIR